MMYSCLYKMSYLILGKVILIALVINYLFIIIIIYNGVLLEALNAFVSESLLTIPKVGYSLLYAVAVLRWNLLKKDCAFCVLEVHMLPLLLVSICCLCLGWNLLIVVTDPCLALLLSVMKL